MRIGLQVPRFHWPGGTEQLGPTFARIARHAESAGFYSLWVMDHFFQIRGVGPAEEEMLEGWSALAFAAGKTERIRLGTMVTGVTYRYPGILAKTATTLDVLSGGRSYFGIGAAWNEQEHLGLGVPFPPLKERFERLEETIQIALQMWSASEEPYHGTHNQLERTLNMPQPIQKPHPPILIGGSGEQKTLRLVAKYADACNIFARMGDDFIKRKLDVLRERCDEIGRPYSEIEKTTLGTLHVTRDGANGTKTPSAALDSFAAQAELGIDQAIFSMPNVYEPDAFEIFATEIVPEVSKLKVAGR